jgi:hypothetical protein
MFGTGDHDEVPHHEQEKDGDYFKQMIKKKIFNFVKSKLAEFHISVGELIEKFEEWKEGGYSLEECLGRLMEEYGYLLEPHHENHRPEPRPQPQPHWGGDNMDWEQIHMDQGWAQDLGNWEEMIKNWMN